MKWYIWIRLSRLSAFYEFYHINIFCSCKKEKAFCKCLLSGRTVYIFRIFSRALLAVHWTKSVLRRQSGLPPVVPSSTRPLTVSSADIYWVPVLCQTWYSSNSIICLKFCPPIGKGIAGGRNQFLKLILVIYTWVQIHFEGIIDNSSGMREEEKVMLGPSALFWG